MDCRWTHRLVAALLLVLAGCVVNQTAPPAPDGAPSASPTGSADSANRPSAAPEPIAKERAKELTPKTLVAMALFREQMARECARSEAQREYYLAEARKAYQQALKEDPKYTPAHVGEARHWETLEDKHDKALQCYAAALKLAPKDPGLAFEVGRCYARHKEWENALPHLRSAADLDPANPQFVNWYALALAWSERWDESVVWLKKLHTEAEVHLELARVFYQKQRDDECQQQLELALQLDPKLQPALDFRAKLDSDLDPNASEAAPKAAEPAR
jgi:tetratricopeptide (TPR) repeat protein